MRNFEEIRPAAMSAVQWLYVHLQAMYTGASEVRADNCIYVPLVRDYSALSAMER